MELNMSSTSRRDPAPAPQVRSFAERALGELRSLRQGVSLTSDKVAFMEFMYKVTERILLGEDDPPTAALARLKDLEQVGKQCLQDLLSDNDAKEQFSHQWDRRLRGNQDCAATSSHLPEREEAKKEANLVPLGTTQTYSPGRLEGIADDVQLKGSLPRRGSTTTAHLSVSESQRARDGFEASNLLRELRRLRAEAERGDFSGFEQYRPRSATRVLSTASRAADEEGSAAADVNELASSSVVGEFEASSADDSFGASVTRRESKKQRRIIDCRDNDPRAAAGCEARVSTPTPGREERRQRTPIQPWEPESAGFLAPSPWSHRAGSPASSCFFASAGRVPETRKKKKRATQGGLSLDDRPAAVDRREESRGDPGEALACEINRAENSSRRNVFTARHTEAASPLSNDNPDEEKTPSGKIEPSEVDAGPDQNSDAQVETGQGVMAAEGDERGPDPLELSLDLSDCNDEKLSRTLEVGLARTRQSKEAA